jgi:hypothetical protein
VLQVGIFNEGVDISAGPTSFGARSGRGGGPGCASGAAGDGVSGIARSPNRAAQSIVIGRCSAASSRPIRWTVSALTTFAIAARFRVSRSRLIVAASWSALITVSRPPTRACAAFDRGRLMRTPFDTALSARM